MVAVAVRRRGDGGGGSQGGVTTRVVVRWRTADGADAEKRRGERRARVRVVLVIRALGVVDDDRDEIKRRVHFRRDTHTAHLHRGAPAVIGRCRAGHCRTIEAGDASVDRGRRAAVGAERFLP